MLHLSARNSLPRGYPAMLLLVFSWVNCKQVFSLFSLLFSCVCKTWMHKKFFNRLNTETKKIRSIIFFTRKELFFTEFSQICRTQNYVTTAKSLLSNRLRLFRHVFSSSGEQVLSKKWKATAKQTWNQHGNLSM